MNFYNLSYHQRIPLETKGNLNHSIYIMTAKALKLNAQKIQTESGGITKWIAPGEGKNIIPISLFYWMNLLNL